MTISAGGLGRLRLGYTRLEYSTYKTRSLRIALYMVFHLHLKAQHEISGLFKSDQLYKDFHHSLPFVISNKVAPAYVIKVILSNMYKAKAV